MSLSIEQVSTALEYIEAHRTEIEAEYARIIERSSQKNPDWVETRLAKTPEELKLQILARCNPGKSSSAYRGVGKSGVPIKTIGAQ